MRKRVWLAFVLAIAMFAAACGDSGTDNTTDTTAAATDSGGDGGGSTAGAPLDVDAVLAAASGDCATPTGDPLKIGYAADFSELGGYADGPGAKAAAYMAELINCAGGVNGQPVEVVVEDIQGDPDVTQRAAQDLLDAGVSAILGPPFSDFGLPLLQVVDGKVPVLFVASTETVLSDASINSFLTAFDDEAQATAAAQFALDQGWTTAVTFSSPDAPYFEQNPAMFTEAFEAGGGTVLADYTYSIGDEDYSAQVNEMAGLSEAPQVLYTANIMPFMGNLLGQIEGAGIDIEVIGADGFDATGILDAGDLAEGVYYTTHGFPGEGTRMKQFLDAYAAAKGEQLQTVSFGTLAADAVLIVADAAAVSGSSDPAAIADTIKGFEDLDLVTESVTYKGTSGTPIKPVFIHRIENGQITLAAKVTP